MMDAIAAAATTVAALLPGLPDIVKGAGEGIGKAGMERILHWLHRHLPGRGKEALADLQRDPASADNQANLRKQLRLLLEQNPALLEELQKLLPAAVGGDTMVQTVTGNENKVAQIKGSGSTVNIS